MRKKIQGVVVPEHSSRCAEAITGAVVVGSVRCKRHIVSIRQGSAMVTACWEPDADGSQSDAKDRADLDSPSTASLLGLIRERLCYCSQPVLSDQSHRCGQFSTDCPSRLHYKAPNFSQELRASATVGLDFGANQLTQELSSRSRPLSVTAVTKAAVAGRSGRRKSANLPGSQC